MIVTIDDLRERARRRLPRALFDYIDGGAGDEHTLRANQADFGWYTFRPRVPVDVSRRDQSATVLGQREGGQAPPPAAPSTTRANRQSGLSVCPTATSLIDCNADRSSALSAPAADRRRQRARSALLRSRSACIHSATRPRLG